MDFYVVTSQGVALNWPVVPQKLHLVVPTTLRYYGFPKQALCKVAFAGVSCTAVYAPLWLQWHRGQLGAARCVLISGIRSLIVCVPSPTLKASPASRALAFVRRSARLPPTGAGGGTQSPALAMIETTRHLTRRKCPHLN